MNHIPETHNPSSSELARAESLLSAAGLAFTAVDRCPAGDCPSCTVGTWSLLHEAA